MIQRIQLSQTEIINLSPAWVKFFKYIQSHPYIVFRNLEFKNGDPFIAEREVQGLEIIESLKF